MIAQLSQCLDPDVHLWIRIDVDHQVLLPWHGINKKYKLCHLLFQCVNTRINHQHEGYIWLHFEVGDLMAKEMEELVQEEKQLDQILLEDCVHRAGARI